MLYSEGFYDKLIEGWEFQQTDDGCPYYVNHETHKTQWDHPFYCKTIEEVGEYACIKYAAYRTALKVRFLQKRFSMGQVDMKVLMSTLSRHGLEGPISEPVSCAAVESVLRDLMESSQQPSSPTRDLQVKAELLLNLILNLYDKNRKGKVNCLSLKVLLGTLCSGKLAEKYKFYFKQMENKNKRVTQHIMEHFLSDLLKLVELLEERTSFGGMSPKPAVESCFSQAWSGSIGVSEEEFVSWLMKEPQTIVWLPTMHRLTAAESVTHDCRCSICKVHPINGFRYKCLKCFNYDMCQQCFFTGKLSKNHKVKHPTQEYCLSTSKKEDTKAFMRTIRNNLSKKHRNKQKPRYLPVYSTGQHHDAPVEQEDLEAEIENPVAVARPQTKPVTTRVSDPDEPATLPLQASQRRLDIDERRELAAIIQHLEDENRELMRELELMHSQPPSVQAAGSQCEEDSGSDHSDWIERDKMDAKQEIIEAHNRQLQKQLYRLRAIVNQEEKDAGQQRAPLAPLSDNTLHYPQHPHLSPSPITHSAMQDNQPSSNMATPVNVERDRPISSHGNPMFAHSIPTTVGSSHPALQHMNVYTHTPHERGRLPLTLYNSPDSLGGLAVDTTVSSGDVTLGRTHYSLPSLNHSRHYPEEEAQLAELIARMDKGMPLDMSKDELIEHEGMMGEMLHAAGQIGDAFAGMVTDARQSEIAALEKKYESSA